MKLKIMNIFVLSLDPKECAQMHVDRHVVKMVVEYAQIMSTVHRYLDGTKTLVNGTIKGKNKEKILYLFPNENWEIINDKFVVRNPQCYAMTHKHHPCVLWAMSSSENYKWLYQLFTELATEFEFRFGKMHKTWETVGKFLSNTPKNIEQRDLTKFALAMPDEYKDTDAPQSYRNYIIGAKNHFAKWSKRSTPQWFLV